MAIITGQVTLGRGLRAEFEKQMSVLKPDPTMSRLTMNVKSTVSIEKYGWLGQSPSLVEWVDTRKVKGAINNSYTLKNKAYESTIGVDRFDLKNDQVGSAFQRTRNLTARGIEFPTKLLWDSIIAGDAAGGEAYDGQFFYDSDHEEGDSGVQTNILAGGGVTSALLKADFQSVQGLMLGFKDSAGEPIRNGSAGMDWIVTAPAALLGAFQELQNAAIISNTTNTIKGLFDLVASGRLTTDDANDWYMHEVGMVKPFITQENVPLVFEALEGNSDIGFTSRTFLYGVSWYGAVGYGFWQASHQITNA